MLDNRREQVSKRAYAIWEAEGYPHGRDREHWRQAEAEIDDARPGTVAVKPAAINERTGIAAAPSMASKVVSSIGRKKRR
jgi:hypothetical protein